MSRRPSSRRIAVIAAFAAAGLMAALAATSVMGAIVPDPVWFWDVGNDGAPDPSVGVDADGSGTGWTSAKLDRLTSATNEWAADTQFEPYRVVSGPNKVYVDGTIDQYCTGWDAPYAGASCIHRLLRTFPGEPWESYYDISSAMTTMTTNPSPFVWWHGSTHESPANGLDFQGVLTHELGHWVLLNDIYGSACQYGTGMVTMCGQPESFESARDDTWRMRSLTSTDISATNLVY